CAQRIDPSPPNRFARRLALHNAHKPPSCASLSAPCKRCVAKSDRAAILGRIIYRVPMPHPPEGERPVLPRLTPHNRNERAILTIAAAFVLFVLDPGLRGAAALGQTAFDSPEVRATADVLPETLLRGAHYQLGPTVSTFAFMNQYSVTSDYGPF